VSKREKGKIARNEWPAIIARHRGGETLASIARSYACTAPAIRYIVNRDTRAPGAGTPPRMLGGAGSERRAPVNEPEVAAAEADLSAPLGDKTREAIVSSRGSGIDRQLRERVNSDIAVFLVAFDAAFLHNSPGNRQALLDATDRLLRAGARTRIALEGMGSNADADRDAATG
jgi:hypothetical protein